MIKSITQLTFPSVGFWTVEAHDSNTNWKANMAITSTDSLNFKGYFEWSDGADRSGKEYFNGEFKSSEMEVLFIGYQLENDKGINIDNYRASLSKN